jgi:hypothetical protein
MSTVYLNRIEQRTTATSPNIVGSVIKTSFYMNRARSVTSSTASTSLFSFSFTKRESSSILIIDGMIPTTSGDTDGDFYYTDISGSTNYTGISGNATTATGAASFITLLQIYTTINTSGSKTFSFGWSTANGAAARPVNIINPDRNDDGRNWRTATSIVIYEVAQ